MRNELYTKIGHYPMHSKNISYQPFTKYYCMLVSGNHPKPHRYPGHTMLLVILFLTKNYVAVVFCLHIDQNQNFFQFR